jgi:hypothetical protein
MSDEQVTGGPRGGRLFNGNSASEIRLSLPQGVAFHALQRNIAALRGDAQLLQNCGEMEIAKAFLGTASLLEGACEKYLADTQRTIIPAGGLVVPR